MQSFKEFLDTQLNDEQRSAVTKTDGPLLVIAGAGSGKTRVITARITNLLQTHDVPPHAIVALTFTNKAAREMKERIARFLPNAPALPFVGTFHGYCLQLLRSNRHLLEHPTFSILDADDQIKLISDLLKRRGLSKQVTPRQMAYHISKLKNAQHTPKDLADQQENDPTIAHILHEYEAEKRASKCFDFDDLLLEVLRLLRAHESFKKQLQTTVRHLLVDEYQDTNFTQHALLTTIARVNKKLVIDSLCVVGDEDQSIYSWRGATVSNILNFKKDFPGTKTVKIEQNYRSAKPILAAANTIIANNRERNPKKLWSAREGHDRVRILQCFSGYQEGQAVTTLVQTLRAAKPEASIAVLYRAHYQSRTLEELLVKHNLPYLIIGGVQFYERKEVKDVLAYLRLLANPFDRVSFSRIINTPTRGLGPKFVELFLQTWGQEPLMNAFQLAAHLLKDKQLKPAQATSLERFVSTFAGLSHTCTPSDAAQTIIKRTGYYAYLHDSCEPNEEQERRSNVAELLTAMQHFEQQGADTVELFLQEISLLQAVDAKQHNTATPSVQLMTLHASKGLEFDVVVLTGLEEGTFPTQRSLQEHENVEEERRLLYVGITRAREHLLLTHAQHRYVYGGMEEKLSSRFLDEIPKQLAQVQDARSWGDLDLHRFCQSWFGLAPAAPQLTAPVQTYGPAHRPPAPRTKPTRSGLRKHQTVKHTKFGLGIVQKIEKRAGGKTVATVRFGAQIKKIDASFLQIL